jgi:hypothetical protein
VPLGQGWALGHPQRPWAPVDGRAAITLRDGARPRVDSGAKVGLLLERATFAGLSERERAMAATVESPVETFVVVIDEYERPVGSITPEGARVGQVGPVLAVSLSTPVTDVAFRSLTRPVDHRFEPVVCTDPAGRALGIVRIERIIELLARAATD